MQMDPQMLIHYERMAASLRDLASAIRPAVPEQELQEATEKIDHDEFGIAVQVLGALILEHDVRLAPEARQQMIGLIEQMGMMDPNDEDYWFWEKMRAVLQSGN
jgi:hypothetical protein